MGSCLISSKIENLKIFPHETETVIIGIPIWNSDKPFIQCFLNLVQKSAPWRDIKCSQIKHIIKYMKDLQQWHSDNQKQNNKISYGIVPNTSCWNQNKISCTAALLLRDGQISDGNRVTTIYIRSKTCLVWCGLNRVRKLVE